MKKCFFIAALVYSLTLSPLSLSAETAIQYGIAKQPTPVFNTADFKSLFIMNAERRKQLSDDCHHMKELEFIALPKTIFIIEDTIIINGIIVDKVTTSEYPYPNNNGYYVDDRFIKHLKSESKPRTIHLPSIQNIINRMLTFQGKRYIWGGNYQKGVTNLSKLYDDSSNHKVDTKILDKLQFKGLDCSGLLYEATDGYTPRNTSKLITFGNPVEIKNLGADEIIQKIEPLDIIVWRGHMMAIIDKNRLIESREDYDKTANGCQGGVKVRELKPVLKNLLAIKKEFSIRRWYPALK